MNSRFLRNLFLAVLVFSTFTNKLFSQVPLCYFQQAAVYTISSNVGLSVSGIPLSSSQPVKIVITNGASLFIDQDWTANGNYFFDVQGSFIRVMPNIKFTKTGGCLYNSWGGAFGNGIIVQQGGSLEMDGVEIYFFESAIEANSSNNIIIKNCTFSQLTSCVRATSCKYVSLEANTLDGVGTFLQSNLSSTVRILNSVQGNTVISSTLLGFVTVTNTANLTINDNDFNVAGPTDRVGGILAGYITQAEISGNNLDVISCKTAMDIYNVQNLTINDNSVYFERFTGMVNGSNTARGIFLSNCPAISLNNNTVNSKFTGTGTTPGSTATNLNSRGFDINVSSGSIIGNTVSNTNIGFAFSGVCGLAENFRGNNIGSDMFSRMDVGLWVFENSSIGHQTCPLNIWRGTFNAHGARWESATPTSQEIMINSDDFNEWPISLPSQNPPSVFPLQWWFVEDITHTCPLTEFTGGGDVGEREGLSVNQDSKANQLFSIQVSIQPNPTSDLLQIIIPETGLASTIAVYDLAGNLVKTVEMTSNQTTSELNTSSFSKGIYLLKIRSGDFVHTGKIVKI